jgi:hypothetical protein
MQIEDYDKHAEQKFRENFSKGRDTIISEARPKKATTANTIRAGLIRALLLGTGNRTPRPEDCGSRARGLLNS